jgi:4,5-dihydroxyphthalate decarboxylase
MTELSILLGDYPHTRPLKDGSTMIDGVKARYAEASPLYSAFARMVRSLEYDICEMALVTYLQAREAGVPITLLPVVMIGSAHHKSLTRLPDGPPLAPEDLVGRRVGVRSYSQTTGLWVRGILQEDYGVAPSDVTWVTTEEPHVATYREPANVERSAAGTVAELLRTGAVDAAVLGPRAIGGQGEGLVPLVRDAEAAADAWVVRHGTVPINHTLVVRDEVLRAAPDAVRAFYQAIVTLVPGSGWTDPFAAALEVAARYALEQELVRTPVDLDAIEKSARAFER